MSKKPATNMPAHSYDGIGRCIYCGTEMAAELLTKEHIIPTALAGKLVFQNAACEPCRAWSNEGYEQTALKNDFLVPRLLLALKKSTSALPFVGLGPRGHEQMTLMLDVARYPKVFAAVIYQTPGLLAGVDRGDASADVNVMFCDLGIGHELVPLNGVTAKTTHAWPAHTRTLAKIGYCFGVAELGWDGFDGDAIRDFIAGKRHDALNFVGSAHEPVHRDSQLHRVSLFERDGFVVARVKLFASCSLDPYLVVLGRARGESKQ